MGVFQSSPVYEQVDIDEDLDHDNNKKQRRALGKLRVSIISILVVILCLAAGWMAGMFSKTLTVYPRCKNLHVRREWRSLSTPEKDDYIQAVRCLLSKPSITRPNGVLYDDYPYTHARVGGYSHNAAPFLPWHRYFLHIYEINLQTYCDYNGSLPYWDWTLDWESLRDSPVFSNITGFGGDGNMEGPESVGDGHGVTDGPFADLILPFYNSDDHDHCLSRAFADGKTRGTLPGDQVRPAVVEEILSQTDYKSFFLQLEKGPHNQIPNGIGGDFLKFTAPNDPLFFLHHGQLDRLWWMWQRANPEARKRDYGGISRHASKVPASLQDAIPMGELSSAIRVIDMMDTETGMLCYTY